MSDWQRDDKDKKEIYPVSSAKIFLEEKLKNQSKIINFWIKYINGEIRNKNETYYRVEPKRNKVF